MISYLAGVLSGIGLVVGVLLFLARNIPEPWEDPLLKTPPLV